jgi:hypothetical protein
MLRVVDAKTGEEAAQDADGAFVVWDQREYLVQAVGEPLRDQPPVLQVQALGDVARLAFDNYVGLAEVLGHPFRVRHGKLTDEAFDQMLNGIVAEVADLAFDFGSPTSLPFEREARLDAGVDYHALAYLRHVMRRADEGERLLGQFLQVARNPHRHMEREQRWVETGSAATVGSRGLQAIVTHPERLGPLPVSSRLLDTGLGRALSRRTPLFPTAVLVDHRVESVDTHENRLVKHVLSRAIKLVHAFDGKHFVNPGLRSDLRAMREELEWMASFSFLADVGELTLVPFQSSVMQRREGYRDFLGHHVQLGLTSTLAGERDIWERLLDLKDGALLYELWSFFEVKRVLDGLLGQPSAGELTVHDDERRAVPWSARAQYDDVELIYNRSYGRRSGSYSVTFRPDIVVRHRRGLEAACLVLDAKLKFDGTRLGDIEGDDPEDWPRSPTRADLYKMHTYRDAVREAVGAFVLYPGTASVVYPAAPNGQAWEGIGAVPLLPGGDPDALRKLLSAFLRIHKASAGEPSQPSGPQHREAGATL